LFALGSSGITDMMKSPIQTAFIMNYACFPDLLPGLKCAILHPDPPRSFGCLVATNFTEEGLFVYLSSFLEKAI